MSVKLFMSYKSEDAVAVRMIAELLRAQGVGVWFAEYDISVENRSRFQDLIEVAATECDYGICFTNDLYADSEFCRREVEILLQHLPPERILEIAFPRESKTHAQFPALASAKSLVVPIVRPTDRSASLPVADANRILAFIGEATGIPLAPCEYEEPGYSKRIEDRRHGVRYSIDLAGWAQKNPDLFTRLSSWRSLGLMYERYTPDGSHMWGHVLAGPQDASIKRIAIGSGSDREYYEEALKFADFFYRNIHAQHCAGVHLLFSEGVSHPAFTTITRDSMAIVMGQQVWMRLYSVVLCGRFRWSRDVEFAFFFFVRGSLQSFLRAAHSMDRLVLSFRRESRQCPRQQKRSRDTPKRSARHSPTNERKSRRWYDIAYYLKTRGSPLYWPFMFATVLLQSIAVRVVLLLLAISLPVYFLSKHVDEKEFAKWGVRASAVQLGSPKEQVFGALPPLPQVDGQSVMTNQGHLIRWRVAKDICVVASFDPDSGTLNERMRVEKAQQSEVSAQRSEPAPAPQEARDAAKAWKEIPVHFKVILLVSIVITFAIRRRGRFTTARGPNPIGRGIASGTRDFWCFIAVYVGLALLWNLFVLIQKALF